MQDASNGSKKKPGAASATKDDAALDGSLGYVSVTEIRNLFTERIRDLDTRIWPRDRTPYRDEIIDFYVTTMIDLMQKAQRNYEQFCRRNPIMTRQATTKPAATQEDAAQQQKAFDERKARLEKWQKT